MHKDDMMFDAEALRELRAAVAVHPATTHLPDGSVALVTPKDFTLHKLPPLDPLLSHIKQRVTLHAGASFHDYVNEFKTPVSRIFAEPGFLAHEKMARVVAILDYHRGSHPIAREDGGLDAEGVASGTPDRAAHVAVYAPRYSEPWEAWHAACAQPLDQVAFAELIEERRSDIVAPFAAELLDMVTTFKATKKVEYDSLTYQRDSSVKLHYSETAEKAGSTVMPEKLKLGIPVYYRGSTFEVDVWIRFKVGNGGVKFALKIDRADRIEDAAFEELTSSIVSKTNVPLHLGRL